MKILVIGGTGTVGSTVVTGLLKQGVMVRVMSHSPDKLKKLPAAVEGFRADLDDPDTLPAAFDGIDGVFLLNAVGLSETNEGLLAVSAAKAAAVKKIVYLSVFMPEGSEKIPHFRSKLPVEKAIKESGIAYTILRPNNFFQNDLWLKDAIMQYSVYPQPIGGKGLNRVDVRDIADCAINVLMKPGHEGRTYGVHGPDTLTGEGIAGTYTKHLGREVRYSGNDLDAWAEKAKNMMPEFMVPEMRIMYQFFQENGMLASKDDLEKMQKLLGHKPRTFDDFVKEITVEWRSKMAKAA
ncbi:MAG: NmrA family NAD(P)-binding protein [Nitrospirota bacterium]